MAIVFRDHNLSDLIGFAYQSWVSRDAASDLIHRLKEIRRNLASATGLSIQAQAVGACSAGGRKVQVPLVTIALDGENAWEYYPRDGRDFLQYLYESLSADPEFRCVTISEHLNESPPVRSLDWLHTGSWIGGDLRTWCGDTAQNAAWDLLHRARDAVASHTSHTSHSPADSSQPISAAWRHILVAEGSDWFWWFGDHHHTDLDHVWDLNFRRHLQAAYQSLGEPVPLDLYMPLLEQGPTALPALPRGPVSPVIDGVMETGPDPSIGEWALAGSLSRDLPSTMQRADGTNITRVHFGWQASRLCILIIPEKSDLLTGLEIELRVTWSEGNDDPVVRFTLEDNGQTQLSYVQGSRLGAEIEVAWKDVIEIALPLETASMADTCLSGLVLHIGRGGLIEHVFHSAGLASLGWGGE